MNNVHLINHILIDHKIAILRDEKTKCKQFREVIEEIAMLETLEVLKDAPTKTVTVKTPLEMVEQTIIKENSIVIVPILRAGLGMVNGVTAMLPAVKVRTYRYSSKRGNIRACGVYVQTTARHTR